MRIRFSLFALLLLGVTPAFNQQPPGVAVGHELASTKKYIVSPSIVVAPNGDYIASHDVVPFGHAREPGATEDSPAVSKVFVSKDRGATWKQTAELHEVGWAKLFVLKGRVYLLGRSAHIGRLVIRTSDDNGQSWSDTHYLTESSGDNNTAATAVVVHDGRIYSTAATCMMWASIDGDLTKASSWSFSNCPSFPKGPDGHGSTEGNALVAPDGSVVHVRAVRSSIQHIEILKLDGAVLKLDRFADMPGGASKFTMRFDPVSKLYWTLASTPLPGETETLAEPSGVRNTLTLLSSPDLDHWTPRQIVLHHPDTAFHAFQYADWQFDGDDIILVSRTAFDDAAGGANSYHNANYMTFHRVKGFRKLGTVKLTGSPFTHAEVIQAKRLRKFFEDTEEEAEGAPDGIANKPVGRYGNHTTGLTARTKTGEAEQHRDWSDIIVPLAGEASLVSGGHLADPKTTAPGEQRGSAVVGGTTEQLTPGAVVHIDPGIPHQLIVPDGKPFTYYVVKVKSEKTVSK